MSIPQFPIAKPNIGVFQGLRLNFATMPFPVTRLVNGLAYGAATFGVMVVWLGLVVLAHLYTHVAVTSILFIAGALFLALFWIPFVQRKSFLDRCAHTVVLTRLVTHGDTGSQNVVDDARQYVQRVLGTGDDLDQTINATASRVRMLVRRVNSMSSSVPIEVPGLSALANWVARMMMPFVSSAVIAYVLVRHDVPPRQSADDGLCYVAQNGQGFLGACLKAAFAERFVGTFVFLSIFAVVGGITYAIAGAIAPGVVTPFVEPDGVGTAVTAFEIAALVVIAFPLSMVTNWVLREALVRPGMTAFVVGRFLETIRGQALDPQWRSRIENLEEFARTGRIGVQLG